jgi:hypothetical protein
MLPVIKISAALQHRLGKINLQEKYTAYPAYASVQPIYKYCMWEYAVRCGMRAPTASAADKVSYKS